MTALIIGDTPRICLYTIGVYGFTEEAFFQTLQSAGIDTFCDLRARRGVRGREYAFANSNRLQTRLKELGVRYRHHPELAPDRATRLRQYEVDKTAHVAKRRRIELSSEFTETFVEMRLREFNCEAFVANLGPETRRIVLCCVERDPAACHRSLVADRICRDLQIEVTHLLPPDP